MNTNQTKTKMTQTQLTFEQVNALRSLIEFHDDWDEVSEIVGTNLDELYDTLTELRGQFA